MAPRWAGLPLSIRATCDVRSSIQLKTRAAGEAQFLSNAVHRDVSLHRVGHCWGGAGHLPLWGESLTYSSVCWLPQNNWIKMTSCVYCSTSTCLKRKICLYELEGVKTTPSGVSHSDSSYSLLRTPPLKVFCNILITTFTCGEFTGPSRLLTCQEVRSFQSVSANTHNMESNTHTHTVWYRSSLRVNSPLITHSVSFLSDVWISFIVKVSI